MTIKEVRKMFENQNYIYDDDTYQYTDQSSRIVPHCDHIRAVELDENIDYSTLQYHMMNMNEYDNTILANTSLTHAQFDWDDTDMILIITIDYDEPLVNTDVIDYLTNLQQVRTKCADAMFIKDLPYEDSPADVWLSNWLFYHAEGRNYKDLNFDCLPANFETFEIPSSINVYDDIFPHIQNAIDEEDENHQYDICYDKCEEIAEELANAITHYLQNVGYEQAN
jgi:hypothetical protein